MSDWLKDLEDFVELHKRQKIVSDRIDKLKPIIESLRDKYYKDLEEARNNNNKALCDKLYQDYFNSDENLEIASLSREWVRNSTKLSNSVIVVYNLDDEDIVHVRNSEVYNINVNKYKK